MPAKSCSPTPRLIALAVAALCASLSPAWGEVSVTGSFTSGPVFATPGPGNSVLPTTGVLIGNPGTGSLLVNNGSFLQLARLSFGDGGTGNGTGSITGAGSLVQLVGDGAAISQVQKLQIGNWGTGLLTVNAGAILDTRVNQSPCLLAFHYCDSFVGTAAGDNGTLNIDGAGTQVRIGQNLFVSHPGLVAQNGIVTFGIPGGTTRATVNVTNGALLSTDRAQISTDHWDHDSTGSERNYGEVNLSGAGSRWVVTGGNRVDHATGNVIYAGGSILTALHPNAWATINITNGAVLELQGAHGFDSNLQLTQNGGRTDMRVSGSGSAVVFSGDRAVFQIGRRNGTARVLLEAGASVTGVNYTSVGRDGAFAELSIDGLGTVFSLSGIYSGSANSQAFDPGMDIGRNGTGVVTVRNGGKLEIVGSGTASIGPGLSVGRDAASSGTLNITGSASEVRLSAISAVPGGGATEAFNPLMRVGRDGSGHLNITQGGKLLIDGQAVSTVANSRNTMLYIGGSSGTAIGGRGIALVSGVGSEIRLTGSDSIVAVGRGPQSSGQLTVLDQATVSAMGILVGDAGGTGVLRLDNARLNFSGQQTGDLLVGAFAAIGNGGGIGVATMANGSVLNLTNMGSAGAGMVMGGTSLRPLGDGSLTMAGASQINIQAAPGLGSLTVGRSGSALMRVRGASTVNVGDGNVYVARFTGSDGTLLMSEGSSLTAGWMGVGRNKTPTGSEDGGTGTVVLVNSSLTVPTIVIGSNGFLGGTGTITGNVTNYGIFAPGNSPGTLEINGSFVAQAGSRTILEIESDGSGGFLTDRIIFSGSQTLDLAHLNAQFRFLGNTDPAAFQTQGLFDINTFFQTRNTNGDLQNLAPSIFSSAVFTAQADAYTISNFSFTAASGATFVAAAVPEPESWAMMLAGLLAIGGMAYRRRRT